MSHHAEDPFEIVQSGSGRFGHEHGGLRAGRRSDHRTSDARGAVHSDPSEPLVICYGVRLLFDDGDQLPRDLLSRAQLRTDHRAACGPSDVPLSGYTLDEPKSLRRAGRHARTASFAKKRIDSESLVDGVESADVTAAPAGGAALVVPFNGLRTDVGADTLDLWLKDQMEVRGVDVRVDDGEILDASREHRRQRGLARSPFA